MAKSSKEAYDLTDAEKRDLIQLIQEGKALPEKYRFIPPFLSNRPVISETIIIFLLHPRFANFGNIRVRRFKTLPNF